MLSDMMHEKHGRFLLYTIEVPLPSSPIVTLGIGGSAGGAVGGTVGVPGVVAGVGVCKNR